MLTAAEAEHQNGDGESEEGETEPLLPQTHIQQSKFSASSGTSWFASSFVFVNAALGAGLLNFPAAYDQCGGIGVALVIQAILIVLVASAMAVLLYCAHVNNSASYQDVVLVMCGKSAQMLCATCIAIYCFGTCITFFIIIGDQWDKFLTSAYGPDYCHHWYMSRWFTMVTSCTIIILPLSFAKRIDFLKYASYAAVMAVLYCAVLVSVKYFVGPVHPGPIKTSPDHWTDVFVVVPVICFGYQCQLSVIPIYSCMKKHTLKEFSKTAILGLSICVACYTGTATFGYLSFGSRVNPDILMSYKPTPDVLVATVMVAAKMYTSFPILHFIGRSALDSVWTYYRKLPAEAIASGERSRRITSTLILFSTSLLLGVFVPNIGVVISLLGGLAGIFLFVFPGLCMLQLTLGGVLGSTKLRHWLCLAAAMGFIVLGVFVFGLVTTQSIWNDVMYGGTKPHTNRTICD